MTKELPRAVGAPLDAPVRPIAERLRRYGQQLAICTEAADALDQMQTEIDELDALRNKLAALLSATAVALRGPEPPLTRWSWHDLPERAAAAIAAIDLMQRTAQHLTSGRLHDSDCAMHDAPAYPAGECDCGALGPNAAITGGHRPSGA